MTSTKDLNDFADTAALMKNLDLVISVCTSTVHLAGALGRPVWLLNRFDTDWRWFLDRIELSLVSHNACIFRQPEPRRLNSVMRAVADALRDFVADVIFLIAGASPYFAKIIIDNHFMRT